jgi:hypothetical protein
MSERNGTANLLNQLKAFRELSEDYGTDSAENLTARNLQRNGVDANVTDVKGWVKVSDAALQGNLDIPAEVIRAEEKAAIAAGIAIDKVTASVIIGGEDDNSAGEEEDDEDDGDGDDHLLTEHDMYQCETQEDSEEQAYDDVLKIQENS